MIVVPKMVSGGNTSVQTNATGSPYTAFPDLPCKQLTIVNDTGTSIEFRQDGAGVAIPVATGSSFSIFGIANANVIEVRRVDVSNTQVTVKARWEA